MHYMGCRPFSSFLYIVDTDFILRPTYELFQFLLVFTKWGHLYNIRVGTFSLQNLLLNDTGIKKGIDVSGTYVCKQ